MAVVKGLARFDGDERAFRSWLLTITHRRLVDDLRRRGRRPVSSGDEQDLARIEAPGSIEDEGLARLQARGVLAIIDSLTAAQRGVLLLRLLADLSVAEIARVVDKPESAVKALLRRGLAALARQIGGGVDAPWVASLRRWGTSQWMSGAIIGMWTLAAIWADSGPWPPICRPASWSSRAPGRPSATSKPWSPPRSCPAPPRTRERHHRGLVAAAAAAAFLVLAGGMAAAGALPRSIQHGVAVLVHPLGIELPDHDRGGGTTSHPHRGPAGPTSGGGATLGAREGRSGNGFRGHAHHLDGCFSLAIDDRAGGLVEPTCATDVNHPSRAIGHGTGSNWHRGQQQAAEPTRTGPQRIHHHHYGSPWRRAPLLGPGPGEPGRATPDLGLRPGSGCRIRPLIVRAALKFSPGWQYHSAWPRR